VNKKILIVSAILLLLILSTVTIFIIGSKNTNPYSKELTALIDAELSDAKNQVSRPDYLPKEMFSELPKFPSDLYQRRVLLKYNLIEYTGWEPGSEYWLQPEWSNNFESIWLPLIQNPPVNRWGAAGYSVNPGDVLVQVIRGKDFEGTSLKSFTYLRSGPLIQTYQGITINTFFPASGSIAEGFATFSDRTKIATNPSDLSKYINVSVEIIDEVPDRVSGNTVVIEPSFPIFKKGYAVKLVIRADLSKDIPAGKYVIGVSLDAPTKEYLTIGTKYKPGGDVGIGRPWYQMFIEVN
jgi:hypothetical protein